MYKMLGNSIGIWTPCFWTASSLRNHMCAGLENCVLCRLWKSAVFVFPRVETVNFRMFLSHGFADTQVPNSNFYLKSFLTLALFCNLSVTLCTLWCLRQHSWISRPKGVCPALIPLHRAGATARGPPDCPTLQRPSPSCDGVRKVHPATWHWIFGSAHLLPHTCGLNEYKSSNWYMWNAGRHSKLRGCLLVSISVWKVSPAIKEHLKPLRENGIDAWAPSETCPEPVSSLQVTPKGSIWLPNEPKGCLQLHRLQCVHRPDKFPLMV